MKCNMTTITTMMMVMVTKDYLRRGVMMRWGIFWHKCTHSWSMPINSNFASIMRTYILGVNRVDHRRLPLLDGSDDVGDERHRHDLQTKMTGKLYCTARCGFCCSFYLEFIGTLSKNKYFFYSNLKNSNTLILKRRSKSDESHSKKNN